MSNMELTFAKNEIEDLKRQMNHARSSVLTLLLDLKVMLEEGEYEEAIDLIKEHVGE